MPHLGAAASACCPWPTLLLRGAAPLAGAHRVWGTHPSRRPSRLGPPHVSSGNPLRAGLPQPPATPSGAQEPRALSLPALGPLSSGLPVLLCGQPTSPGPRRPPAPAVLCLCLPVVPTPSPPRAAVGAAQPAAPGCVWCSTGAQDLEEQQEGHQGPGTAPTLSSLHPTSPTPSPAPEELKCRVPMASLSRALRVAATCPRKRPAQGLGRQPLASVAGPTTEKNVPYQRTLKEEARGPSTVAQGPSQPLPSTAAVVVIGGGSLGCQTLYHLAKLGVSGAVLLERERLTSGTTWHTAGRSQGLGGGRGYWAQQGPVWVDKPKLVRGS